MRTRKKIFIGLGIIALIAGIYGYQEYTRGSEDLAYVRAKYKIEAKEFIKEFETNEITANEKFLDKIVAVSGTIKEIIRDEKGFYTIMLGEKSNSSSVRCSIDHEHKAEADLFQIGSRITIKGACTGFNGDELLGSDVILNRCVIEK